MLLCLLLTILGLSCDPGNRSPIHAAKKPVPAVGITPSQDTLEAPLVRHLDTCQPPLVISTSHPSGRYCYNNNIYHITPPVTVPAGFWSPMVAYTADQGLFSTIECLFRDRDGYLWFGTDGGGVIRYDGNTFITYTTSHGLGKNSVRAIAQDNKGDLWFGSMAGGVSRYDGRRFTNYTLKDLGIDYWNNSVSSILVDSDNNIWFGTYGGGVSRYDGKKYTVFTHKDGLGWVCNGDCLGADVVLHMLEDRKGSIWFCMGGGGISHYDGKHFTNYSKEQGLGDNIVRRATKDHLGNIWFATAGGGATRFDGRSLSTFNTSNGLADNDVWDIQEDDQGHLWMGTYGGVSRYDGTSFTTFTTRNGLVDNTVSGIVQDKSGSLWFGTYGGGVNRYDRQAFTTFSAKEGFPNSIVTCIDEDSTGNMWFGAAGNGICRYDGRSITTFSTGQGIPFGFIESIKADRNNGLWIGTGGTGATRYDGRTFTTIDHTQGLSSGTVYCILHDRQGATWLSTDRGVNRYDGKTMTTFSKAQGLCHAEIFCMAEDRNGCIWLGSSNGGVSRYDGHKFTNYTSANGLASNEITDIHADKAGNIWIGSDGAGVTRYDGKTFLTFTTTDGLANDHIQSIAEDKKGVIWMGTNEGFCGITAFKNTNRLLPADTVLGNSVICDAYTPVFETYNFKNGYPVRNVRARTMFIDSKDIIWAGVGDLLLRFDRGAIRRDTTSPHLSITSLKINGKDVIWYGLQNGTHKRDTRQKKEDSLAMVNEELTTYGSLLGEAGIDTMCREFAGVSFDSIGRSYPVPYGLVLPYVHNNITFSFAAISPSRAAQVRYRYMLEGYDKEWGQLSDRTSATFGNMTEGTYTFKLQALNPDGVLSLPVTYTFKILPPLYRTWWAYGFYLVAIALGIYALLRWRTLQLRKEKERLEQVIVERTAEVVMEKTEVERQKKVADGLLVQKDILMKEIHHRVKNNLQVISTLLDLQLDNITDDNARKAISEGMGRIRSISLIHQQLYQGDEMAYIEFSRFAKDLMFQVSIVFNKPGQKIAFANALPKIMLDIDTAVPLGLILNELMTNSYKYAFPDGAHGSIFIHLHQENDSYRLSYKDSGPGLPADLDMNRSSTLGMMVIRDLSTQLGGGFSYDRETMTFIVRFKDAIERRKME